MTGLIINDDKEITSSIDKNSVDSQDDGDWDNLYDDAGECVIAKLEKLSLTKIDQSKQKENEQEEDFTKIKEKKEETKKIDYLKFEPKQDTSVNEEENFDSGYSHIIEIYDFPLAFKNENIMNAFKESIGNDNFSLKWVDDTHCLGIFSNENAASRALKLDNALLKTRPVSQASAEGKRMAKRKIDSLRPYKPRPQTSSFVASKLIGASLGLSNMLSKDKLNMERTKLKEAKDRRLKDKDLKESIWNGQA